MILIIGGAYQGKLDYARTAFALRENEIFTCSGTEKDIGQIVRVRVTEIKNNTLMGERID